MDERFKILKEKLRNDREKALELNKFKKQFKKEEKKREKESKGRKTNQDLRIDSEAVSTFKKKIDHNILQQSEVYDNQPITNAVKTLKSSNATKKTKTNTTTGSKESFKASKPKSVKKKVNSNSEQSLKEKREKIKMRVQKHRLLLSEDQLNEKRKKDRERYRKSKQNGLIKSIRELSPKKQATKRKEWKANSQRHRDKKKLLKETDRYLEQNSPPSTDDEQDQNQPPLDNSNEDNYVREENEAIQKESKKSSIKRNVGRQKVKKSRTSCYRKLKESEKQISELKKSLAKYKKQIQRLNLKKIKPATQKITDMDSPETKVNKLTTEINVPPAIKKSLIFGEVLRNQLSENAKQLGTQKDKDIFSKVISGKIIRRYRMVGQASKIISYKMHKKQINNLKLRQYERKTRSSEISIDIRKSVHEFLEKDENTKMCPGKKDFVAKGKVKRQKRILLDSFKNLHKKYLATEPRHRISMTTFWRYRPFWVVLPKYSDRETCACIKHANMELIVSKMFHAKLISAKRPDDLLKELVCDEKNINCMLRRCPKCKENVYNLKTGDVNEVGEIVFRQWESKAENRTIKGESKIIRRTLKTEKKVTVRELLKILNKQAVEYLKHVFFMRHQQREIQKKKKI